ncbi:hypothetical protein IC582_000079 [Cucumis melo]
MATEGRQLHIFMFPFMAHGHMIPIVNMAKLFASRGIKITIVTTPLNSISISRSLHNDSNSLDIHLLILKFPSAEVGLPPDCENVDSLPTMDLLPIFYQAINLLQPSLEEALHQNRPHCLVADMFFPWTNDVADRIGIPRLIFHGTGSFSLCASEFVRLHQPYKHVSSDTEHFLIPYLPGDIKLTKMQLPIILRENVENEYSKFITKVKESESYCYGVVVNSFYELEAEYVDCYRNVLGRKAWPIGPLSLWNNETEQISQRGTGSTIDEHECLKWLDLQKPNSVVYICFGSLAKFNSAQLKEIAIGVEASGKKFIWVVRKGKGEEEEDEQNWLPEGYEQRMEGRGLIIRGWAPQVLILDHLAVGGFVTHCGWNSTLEGVVAGLPMVTWPVAAEQFYNEKLLTEVLKIGVGVGVQKWAPGVGDFIKSEVVEKAIKRIMEEEGEEMRNRAIEFAKKAERAIEKDGSSYLNLDALIEELKSLAF